jgi:hypothetical protein
MPAGHLSDAYRLTCPPKDALPVAMLLPVSLRVIRICKPPHHKVETLSRQTGKFFVYSKLSTLYNLHYE